MHALHALEYCRINAVCGATLDGGQGCVQLRVRHTHLIFVGLPLPEPGAGSALDDRIGHANVTRQVAYLVFEEAGDREQINSSIAVSSPAPA